MDITKIEACQKLAQSCADDLTLYENEGFAAIANTLFDEIKRVKPDSDVIRSIEFPGTYV